ncbi:hypothetical protein [Actinocrispum wychmicini]|uniref:DUF624 domain-containing protein n=1 Tax=Actinocrispum wychmicini TaxID=1213861 RepID=A0A4R2JD45_9PSEU|nr:hypothetical protein [Actinocrispum wychmicini]TCO54746.1 hypothetical protein EV192_10834 [Actinocrispum wychmicini]
MRSDTVIVTTLRGAWPCLPALLVASAALCAAATVPVFVVPGVNPIAVLLYAVLAAPFLPALIAVANAAAFDEVATIRSWARALRAHALFGMRHCLVAAGAGELFLAALEVWSRGRPMWMLPSLALTGAATVVTLSGLLAVLPLGVARPGLRGVRLWITALHLVARRPVRFVAVFSLVGLGLWAATSWSASVLLLLPAPVTLVMVAAVWTTKADLAHPQ